MAELILERADVTAKSPQTFYGGCGAPKDLFGGALQGLQKTLFGSGLALFWSLCVVSDTLVLLFCGSRGCFS